MKTLKGKDGHIRVDRISTLCDRLLIYLNSGEYKFNEIHRDNLAKFIGIDGIQAKTLLVQAGFLFNELEANDPEQPTGVVIRQAPDGGTTQTIGKSVTITINKTP